MKGNEIDLEIGDIIAVCDCLPTFHASEHVTNLGKELDTCKYCGHYVLYKPIETDYELKKYKKQWTKLENAVKLYNEGKRHRFVEREEEL